MDRYGQPGHEAEPGSAILDERRDPETVDNRMMTTGGLARLMGVSVHTAARWCREGRVESWRMGAHGHHRIPVAMLDPQTLLWLSFPRRTKDFFRDADRLRDRMERAA